MSREAMKLALEALEIWQAMHPNTTASAVRNPAITALKQAIAEAEQYHFVEANKKLLFWMHYITKQTHIGHIHDTVSAALEEHKENT